MRIPASAAALSTTLILTACGDLRVRNAETHHETRAIELDKSEMLRVELHLGVGEMRLTGGSPKLLEADFDYQNAARPLVDYHASTFRGDLRIAQPPGLSHSNHATSWNLKLNDARATDLIAHLGVGQANMEAGSLNLRSVEIHMGVGELHLDLRGAPKRSFDVQIHGGVGEATVLLPKNVGVIARASGGIGEVSVQGLEKRQGYWVNAAHEHDPVTIRVDARGGVGEIRMVAE